MRKTGKSVVALLLILTMLLSFGVMSASAYTVGADGRIEYALTIEDTQLQGDEEYFNVVINLNEIYGVYGLNFRFDFNSDYLELDDQVGFIENNANFTSYLGEVMANGSTFTTVLASRTNNSITRQGEVELLTVPFHVINNPPAGTEFEFTLHTAEIDAVNEADAATPGTGTGSRPFAQLTSGTYTYGTAPVTQDDEIVSFETPTTVTVDYGTAIGDITVPTELTANLQSGGTATVPVTYDTTSYNPNQEGDQTFNGTLGTLPEGVANTAGITAPQFTIRVNAQPVQEQVIESFVAPSQIDVAYDTAIGDITVPTELTANIVGGGTVQVPVTYNTASYVQTQEGVQTFDGTLGTLPAGVVNTNNVAVPQLTINVGQAPVPADDVTFTASAPATVDGGVAFDVEIDVTGANNDPVAGYYIEATKDANATLNAVTINGNRIAISGDGAYYDYETPVQGGMGTINVQGNLIRISMAASDAIFSDAAETNVVILHFTAAENETQDDITTSVSFANSYYTDADGNDTSITIDSTTTTIEHGRRYVLGDARNVLKATVGIDISDVTNGADAEFEWLDINDDSELTVADAVLILQTIAAYN